MTSDLNRRCHAAAAQLFGAEAHEQLRSMSRRFGRTSWSAVNDTEAQLILLDLQDALRTGSKIETVAAPGLSTFEQRNRISWLKHQLHWTWARIREMVEEYGVNDWRQMTSEQASHMIQRLEMIRAAYKRKGAHADDHQA